MIEIDVPLRGGNPGPRWIARVRVSRGHAYVAFVPTHPGPEFHKHRRRALAVSGRATLRRLALSILEALDETDHDGKNHDEEQGTPQEGAEENHQEGEQEERNR